MIERHIYCQGKNLRMFTNKLNIQIDFLNVKKIKIVDTFMQAFFELGSI